MLLNSKINAFASSSRLFRLWGIPGGVVEAYVLLVSQVFRPGVNCYIITYRNGLRNRETRVHIADG